MDSTSDNLHPDSTVPVCFNQDNLKLLEKYAKKKGMTDYSQAVEHLAKVTSQD
jgi:hypothetical protein